MSTEEVIKQSYNLLANVIEEAYAGGQEGNLREAFVYRHGLTILQLAEDAIHLEAEQKCHSSPIVVRSMLESLFNLVAAVKRPEFAAEKICCEIDDEVNRIRKWLNSSADLDETIASLQTFAQRIRVAHSIKTGRKWTTLDCAAAAELDQHYRTEYFVFSKKVHATQSGLISSEHKVGRGHIFQTICFIVICTAAHVVKLIQTSTPQRHVDRGSYLLRELTNLIHSGEFQRLDGRLAA